MIDALIPARTFSCADGSQGSRYGIRGRHKIQWIVVHYTGYCLNQGKAAGLAKAMGRWKKSVSTHYLVGEDGIYRCVPDEYAAWHCGTRGIKPKCDANNFNSVGVDLVERKLSVRSNSVQDLDWYFSDLVLKDGARLIAGIADKYDIPSERIVRHFDVTGKECPRPFVGEDINKITGRSHDEGWHRFLELIGSYRHRGEA